jgi:hypothetical protein
MWYVSHNIVDLNEGRAPSLTARAQPSLSDPNADLLHAFERPTSNSLMAHPVQVRRRMCIHPYILASMQRKKSQFATQSVEAGDREAVWSQTASRSSLDIRARFWCHSWVPSDRERCVDDSRGLCRITACLWEVVWPTVEFCLSHPCLKLLALPTCS